jgi:transposase
MPKGTPFSGEFKQRVIEDVINNKIGYREAMRKYGIAGKMAIQKWERIYLTEGASGLYLGHL